MDTIEIIDVQTGVLQAEVPLTGDKNKDAMSILFARAFMARENSVNIDRYKAVREG